MVLVLKLISMAFDVGDGVKRGALTAHQAVCALPQRPSLLAFLGYLLYPGSLLAGPWVPFAEYAAFINRTGVRPACNGWHRANSAHSRPFRRRFGRPPRPSGRRRCCPPRGAWRWACSLRRCTPGWPLSSQRRCS